MKINRLFIALGFFSTLNLYSVDTLNFNKIKVGEKTSQPFLFKSDLPITIEKIKATKEINAMISINASANQNADIELNSTQNINFTGAAFAFVNDAKGNRFSIPVSIKAESHYTEEYDSASFDLSGEKLITSLRTYLNSVHKSFSYKEARSKMFGMVDNYNGVVECPYTGKTVTTNDIPDVISTNFDTEHTWPQSYGAGSEPEKSDINHMRPSWRFANSDRGNMSFGYVVSGAVDEGGGSKIGKNSKGTTVFEVRDEYKGDIARGMFYFALKYGNKASENNSADKYLDPVQYSELMQWHYFDLPSTKETERNTRIKSVQISENPFIEHPQIIERMNLITDFTATEYLFSADSMIVFTNATALPVYFYSEQGSKLEYASVIAAEDNFSVSIADSIAMPHSIYSFDVKHNVSENPHNAELKVKFVNSPEYTIYLKSEATSSVECIGKCNAGINIFPNPADEYTTISINTDNLNIDLSKIELFDSNGKTINTEINKSIIDNSLQFNINLKNVNSKQVLFKIITGDEIKSGIINIKK